MSGGELVAVEVEEAVGDGGYVDDARHGEKKETELYYDALIVISVWVHQQILTIYLLRCVKHHL